MNLEWEALAEEMLEDQIFLADVDASASPEVAKRFHIRGLPTFILLRNRKMFVKPAGTGIEELRHWVKAGWAKDMPFDVPLEKEVFDISAAVKAAVMAGKARYDNLLAATRSQASKGY